MGQITGEEGGAAVWEVRLQRLGNGGLIYVWASNAVSGTPPPLGTRLPRVWRGRMQMQWVPGWGWAQSRAHVGTPVVQLLNKCSLSCRGPWGWAKRILSSAVLCYLSKNTQVCSRYLWDERPSSGNVRISYFFPQLIFVVSIVSRFLRRLPSGLRLVCCVCAR